MFYARFRIRFLEFWNQKQTAFWNLLFGNISGLQANFNHLGVAISSLDSHDYISLGGLGNYQLPINASAIAMGYGVRVGIEDNIWWDAKRTKLSRNIELVKRLKYLRGSSMY